MKTIRLVIGLPGSGKSTYIDTLSTDEWYIIDDPTELILPNTILKIVYADPMFVYKNVLEQAKNVLMDYYGDVKFEYIYFENSPKKCLKNVTRRNDGRRVESFIEQASKQYDPQGDVVLIWDDEE